MSLMHCLKSTTRDIQRHSYASQQADKCYGNVKTCIMSKFPLINIVHYPQLLVHTSSITTLKPLTEAWAKAGYMCLHDTV